jgi:hypothetical protein
MFTRNFESMFATICSKSFAGDLKPLSKKLLPWYKIFAKKIISTRKSTKKVKQLELNIETSEKIVNKKIEEDFSLRDATIYGGYNLLSDYLAANGLDRLLEWELGGLKARWATYPMPMVCRTFIDGYALGLRNVYQFEDIENDPLISAKRGLLKPPDQTVLRKDLHNHFKTDADVDRLRQVKARQVKDVLKKLRGNLVFEYDSVVETGYGSQEGLETSNKLLKISRFGTWDYLGHTVHILAGASLHQTARGLVGLVRNVTNRSQSTLFDAWGYTCWSRHVISEGRGPCFFPSSIDFQPFPQALEGFGCPGDCWLQL